MRAIARCAAWPERAGAGASSAQPGCAAVARASAAALRRASSSLATSPTLPREAARPRSAYRWWQSAVGTRWADNDVYGHLNNTVYYALIDSAVNAYLLQCGALRLPPQLPPQLPPDAGAGAGAASAAIGVVVASGCAFFHSLAYPCAVDAGVRVARVGRSSVTYEVGLFSAGAAAPAAQGHFTHVYVHPHSRRPVAHLPEPLARATAALVWSAPSAAVK